MKDYFPATVIAAIILFVIREAVDIFKKYFANKRKNEALRKLLANEIERNHWAIKALRGILESIEEFSNNPNNPNNPIKISEKKDGTKYIEFSDTKGRMAAHRIPDVYKEIITKSLLDIAAVDKVLFERSMAAVDAIQILTHVRKGVIGDVESKDFKMYLKSFVQYANEELNDVYEALDILYQYCTGTKLTDHIVN